MNRRQFTIRAGAIFLGPAWPQLCGKVDPGPETQAARSYGQETPDMLVSYFVNRMNALAAKWDEVRSQIRTAEDVERRNRFVREKFREMLRGFPPKNPLDPVVVRIHERESYRLENVMFQSQPDFWVTGNLYLPTNGSGPFPGIISPCGHARTARGWPEYQCFYQLLAKSGFVVLAYDPIGQGERRQFWNPEAGTNEIGGPVTWEHDLPGQLLLLLGENLTFYRVWDGMRAIDYMLTRPEVDPKRIGCAGHSGGGTLTRFISVIDERVQCAGANEGGTANRWPIRIPPNLPLGIGDVEQELYPQAIFGIDNVDLNGAIAPRPLLVTIEHDSPEFSKAAEQIRQRYRQLGAAEKFRTVAADDPHALTVKLRLANVDWFSKWFYDRSGPAKEPALQPEPWENLFCTPNGSVRYSHQGQTIFSLILRKQAVLPPARKFPRNPIDFEAFRGGLQQQIKQVVRLRPSAVPLAPRTLLTTPRRGYRIEKGEFVSEPQIYIPVWVFVPDELQQKRKPVVFANDYGKEVDGMEFGPLEEMARHGELIVAVDVRGIGETKPPHLADQSREPFPQLDDVECVLATWGWMMNELVFGMRVLDVLRSVDYALSRPEADPSGVQMVGKGAAALWCLHAAALDPRIESLVCDSGLLSYRALTQFDRYLEESSIFLLDVLRYYDLPQVAASMAPRKLTLLSPRDPMRHAVDAARADNEYAWTREVYSNLGAAGRFRVDATPAELNRAGRYLTLL